jgi:outer membrane lipoprotein-sorting protein
MKKILVVLLVVCAVFDSKAQDMTALINKVKAKMDQVNDYTAEGKMKTDVAFIKAPIGRVKVFYKKPNLFKLQKDGGISILPKGGVTVNMRSIITTNDFMALDAGEQVLNAQKLRVVKLLPTAENSDVVLTTMYIDEANLLVKKAVTTTRENGTYEMEMQYGKFADYGLPDKVIFSFNTKDYKLPKGITLEFDDVDQETKNRMKGKKGRVEITYANYSINKGLASSVFK